MADLNPKKLHVTYLPGVGPKTPVVPRRYTLTHSDFSGDLYLTIGPEYNLDQISGWHTRFMRDEVLAEWKDDPLLFPRIQEMIQKTRIPLSLSRSYSEEEWHRALLKDKKNIGGKIFFIQKDGDYFSLQKIDEKRVREAIEWVNKEFAVR